MEIKLLCTPQGLTPMYDEDYDEKRKLKIGKTYKANVSVPRNLEFHRKYFLLIRVAWEYMSERQREFFRSQESFRKTIEVAAGYFTPLYSVKRKEWVEAPKSISFSSMDAGEFDELYNKVFDTLMQLVFKDITKEEFETILARF